MPVSAVNRRRGAQRARGMSIIELMLTVLIVMILAGIAVAYYSN